jgi:C4-dicarboxylate-specific signal transduction histidine kinase
MPGVVPIPGRLFSPALMPDRSELLETVHRVDMREMFGWLAHELAQPLSAMGAYMGAALRLLDGEAEPRASGALRQGLAQIDRARDAIGAARGHLGGPSDTSFEVAECVREVMAALALPARALVLGPGAARSIVSSREDLQSVLFHLLRNAIEAAEEGSAAGGDPALAVRISVAAHPPGMVMRVFNPCRESPEERWYEAFYTTKSGHLGLGLTVTRRLCQGLGGSVVAAAPAPGEVCFRVELPDRA